MLVGRAVEMDALDQLLDNARAERSAALVVRGEPGIGKSALLAYAAARARDMRVLRCAGVEAEYELPFAGMHQLVRPCLHLVERLPGPQSAAVRSALGLSDGGVDDRFLVCLGLLSLLAEACEDAPVLCCVDDAQWLDAPSAEALSFAVRRFEAERIAVVIAVRSGESPFEVPGVPDLELSGLAEPDASRLLTSRLAQDAAPEVVEGLLADAHGNPLALLELPAALSTAQLQGAQPILGPPPVRPAVEDAFRARVSALPDRTRRVLVIAAADERAELPTIRDAAERLGLAESDLAAAEVDGLIRLGDSVTFRHPLVRSAVYRAANRDDRRAAHEALAAVVADQVTCAWHRALIAERADEGLAGELEAAGVLALARGAQASASGAFERAAELSVDPLRRGHRLTLAAQSAFDAGRPDAALALGERARGFVSDPLDEVALVMLRAGDAGRRGSPAESQRLLAAAAREVAVAAPERASELALWSVMAALGGRRIETAVADAGQILAQVDTSGREGRFATTVVRGLSAALAGNAAEASSMYSQAEQQAAGFTDGTPQILTAFLGTFTGDFVSCRTVMERSVATARRNGSLSSGVGMFPLLAIAQLGDGRLTEAVATIAEGLDIAGRLGFANDETGLLALQARIAARKGDERSCRELADATLRRSLAVELNWATEYARLALAELELGLGNPQAALEQLDQVDPGPVPPIGLLATPDIIDAAVRIGDEGRARLALDRFVDWAPVSSARWVQGLVARCRAVLSGPSGETEALFDAAIRDHLDAPAQELARTRLSYGEWLRRERRKSDARVQLNAARDAFEGLGARLWAARAQAELDATGEKARKRDVTTLEELTPQELRIAQLVADGASNRDVAAQLYVSPKTVEYHLRKIFHKLRVSSRVELARAAPRTLVGEGAN
jgi:DNA-binding CsgD family transcriptional regulator